MMTKHGGSAGKTALIMAGILAIDIFQARVMGKASLVDDPHPIKFIGKNMLYAGALASVFVLFERTGKK